MCLRHAQVDARHPTRTESLAHSVASGLEPDAGMLVPRKRKLSLPYVLIVVFLPPSVSLSFLMSCHPPLSHGLDFMCIYWPFGSLVPACL